MFKCMTLYLGTKVPSIIGAPLFMIVELLVSIAELIFNLDNIFKPMDKWR